MTDDLTYLRNRHARLVGRGVYNRNRKAVPTRRSSHCAYCHDRLNKQNRTIDHVRPLSKDGLDIEANVVWSCVACNNRKGDRLLHIAVIEYEHKMRRRILNTLSLGKAGTLPALWRDLVRCGFACGRVRFLELMRRMDRDGEFGL